MSGPRPAPEPDDDDDARTPKATHAEKLLVQFMVAHPACVPDVLAAGFVAEDCFTRDYREVARLVLHLHARQVIPHWHVVSAALKSADLRLDDPLDFNEFDEGVPRPDPAGLAYFVGVLKDRGRRRRLLLATRKVRSALADPDIPLATALATFEADTREAREDAAQTPSGGGLSPDGLMDAGEVAAEGRALAATGVQYLVDGIIPAYGMLGIEVAFAKVGKTTFGHALGAAVATGRSFLDRSVTQTRVLVIAAEDPPEYTAWLARHLTVPTGAMTVYRRPLRFDAAGLTAITTTAAEGGYGLVLVSSWQSVVAGLVTDENDNAGAVTVVERVKQAARESGVPWLVDAHAGKGEDQSDDADPTRAMRGASAAAGAADYLLSLRYAEGPFSARRRLSGKGRFVSFEPILIDFDLATGTFTALGDGRSAVREGTWIRIRESGVLHDWTSADAIAMAIGATSAAGCVTGTGRPSVRNALRGRAGVDMKSVERRGRRTTLYRQSGRGATMTDSANAIWRSRAAEPFPLRHFATCAYRGLLGAVPPGVAWRGGSCTAPLRHSAPQMEVAQSEAHA